MTKGTELIVLHTTKYSESSLVVHAISREYGRRSFIVRGIGKGARMALFMPMNILEGEVVESNKSKLWLLKNCTAKHSLNGIRGNIYKNTITLFLCEVLFKTIKEGSRDEGLYDWCQENILLLDEMESGWNNFHLRFLLELCSELGFAPSVEALMPFAGTHLKEIEALLSLPLSEALLYPLTGAVRNEIADSLLSYLAFHSESAININSLRVLRELFA